MNEKSLADQLVEKHGEYYRKLIVGALKWLEESEPDWGLETPMNKEEFIEACVTRATPMEKK